MRNHARVVVIGGGIVGISTIYHLVLKGWTDVVLCERAELTSGSTWHAAGLLPLFNMSYSVGQLHKYSVSLYQGLEEQLGLSVGFRQVGNIRLAANRERMDEYHYYEGVAKTIGIKLNFLTADQVKEVWPLCNIEGLVGAIIHPDDGYVQPADLTQALAKGARIGGAEINRRTKVIAIERTLAQEWLVKTDRGDITCEHVVSATGNHARQTGRMVGIDIPSLPVEHQFLVTEPHPEVEARHQQGLPELAVLRESDASYYMREERGGFILGIYERGSPACFIEGPPEEFENDLFQGDLDRLEPHIEAAIKRVPAFGEVGIKDVINGPIPYTPDGSPLVGPAWDVQNFWINEGHSFGITAAGGAGWQLAEWIVEGEPTIDMMGVDPRRFGSYASGSYLKAKNEEAYENVFTIHYPDEERPAARPMKQSPCYTRLRDLGAVFGQVYGWERANWFAPNETEPKDIWSFRRTNNFEHVGTECRHVQEKVGLLDMTAFSKFEVFGPGAEAWLDTLVSNRIPSKIGQIKLCYLLTKNGGVRSEFTIFREAKDRFYLVSAGAMDRHDYDYLEKFLPSDSTVELRRITTQKGVLVVAGPSARSLLQKVTTTSLANHDFKWLSGKALNIGHAPVFALRVNFIGELGWELHHPIEMQNYIFDLLMDAGSEFELKPFGIRAMDSLRIEKSYRLIPRELSLEYSALGSGLRRFIQFDKGSFIGKDALTKWEERGFNHKYVTLEVHDVTDADARGSEPIYSKGELVGRATSGCYGWRVSKSLALAMVPPSLSKVGTELEITILGDRHQATVIEESPYDPMNRRLRDAD